MDASAIALLDQQHRALRPVAAEVARLAARPVIVSAEAWSGLAADACRAAELRLAATVRDAALTLDSAIRALAVAAAADG